MMYWQEEIETMNRSDLQELQLKRLKTIGIGKKIHLIY